MTLNSRFHTVLTYFIGLFILLLSACIPLMPTTPVKPIKSVKPIKPTIPKQKIVLPLPSLQQQIQTKMKRLLKQPYIDPISRFIFTYKSNPAYKNALKTLNKEKSKRCQVIANDNKQQIKTPAQLKKLSDNYHYSCPKIIAVFSQQIAESEALIKLSKKAPGNSQQQAETLQQCQRSYEQLDYAQALINCQQPALYGYADAQLKLGIMYADGRGTAKNYQDAYVWLTLAVQAGIVQAKILRDSIARLLTKEELINAHDKAAKIANAY